MSFKSKINGIDFALKPNTINMINFIIIPILVILTFLLLRTGIYVLSQSHTQCKECKSFDTERVERGFFVKKLMFMSKIHKYWCRKCWSNFYVKP
ncbi:MAG: hypothetical protein ACEQSR_09385 [Candidatus Methylacidiphilales bacterium]